MTSHARHPPRHPLSSPLPHTPLLRTRSLQRPTLRRAIEGALQVPPRTPPFCHFSACHFRRWAGRPFCGHGPPDSHTKAAHVPPSALSLSTPARSMADYFLVGELWGIPGTDQRPASCRLECCVFRAADGTGAPVATLPNRGVTSSPRESTVPAREARRSGAAGLVRDANRHGRRHGRHGRRHEARGTGNGRTCVAKLGRAPAERI